MDNSSRFVCCVWNIQEENNAEETDPWRRQAGWNWYATPRFYFCFRRCGRNRRRWRPWPTNSPLCAERPDGDYLRERSLLFNRHDAAGNRILQQIAELRTR